MKCEKCGGEWIPPKDRSASLMNCPFCGTPVLNAEKAKSYQDMGEFLQYLVSLYGSELYENRQKLNNLIADLYQGDERMKRVYRRAIFDDSLSKRIYDLSLRPLNEREIYYNQLVNQFVETNFYTMDFGKQVVSSLVLGLHLQILLPPIISTIASEEDGEWMDEFGVVYSVDRTKLIKVRKGSNCISISYRLNTYKIKEGTIVICDAAFKDIWSIKVPISIRKSGGDYGCINNIIIPNSVIEVGDNAFDGCRKLRRINIPNSVTRIGDEAFKYCESLETIEIPNSVTSIGDNVFCHCKALRNVTIPDSVKSIGNYAFYDCESLRNIFIPNSVTDIGRCAFKFCKTLHITLETNEHFVVLDDILYTADRKKVIWCSPQKRGELLIPDTVASIGDNAFDDCGYLTSITIPNSVTSIGDYAFI